MQKGPQGGSMAETPKYTGTIREAGDVGGGEHVARIVIRLA